MVDLPWEPSARSAGRPPPAQATGTTYSRTSRTVSWPGCDFTLVNLVSAVGPADSDRLRQWESHLLCSPSDSERRLGQSVVKAPYSDPALMRRPGVYADVLHQLHVRGMVRWTIAYGQRGRLGVFFAKKKSGALRLIFDTRIVNLCFHYAPHTRPPSASSFSGLELEPGSTLYSGTVGFRNLIVFFLGRDLGTLKSDIVPTKRSQLICSDLRFSN